MTSDESDDEPLSVLAASNRLNLGKSEQGSPKSASPPPKIKKKKKKKIKRRKIKISAEKLKSILNPPAIVQRPMDVWLYLKDLSLNGPYSCLLCPEWFINKSKIVIHYIINHKKDYCGICRYFVPDSEAWSAHKKFHVPNNCSQCSEEFETDVELREHLSTKHKLVHCRLCCFMISDNDDYNRHLFQKHNVTNVTNRDKDYFWDIEFEGSPKFHCLLCAKSEVMATDFFRHFMCFHRFTLKCFTSFLSGNDIPFTILGANISPGFLTSQLQQHLHAEMEKPVMFGYADADQKPVITVDCVQIGQKDDENDEKVNSDDYNTNLLDVLIPEIKQEILSDTEDIKEEPEDEATKQVMEELLKYKGDEMFDITLTELIILQDFYYEYVESVLNDYESNTIHKSFVINYESLKVKTAIDLNCALCSEKYYNINDFSMHLLKMHCIKTVMTFSCRLCVTNFETEGDYNNHCIEELKQFDNLWLCQFCDKEFDDRDQTREHLKSHKDGIESDNCYSPHLGFKCRYCPILFWSEPDREQHHKDNHYNRFKENFYKCSLCDDVFSDKIWFTHHYLKQHKDYKADQSVYLLKCNICCLVLSNLDDMKIHFKIDHPEAIKIYCSIDPCKFKPLSQAKSFKFHIKTMHGPKGSLTRSSTTPYISCTVCGREFTNAKACGTHMTLAHGPGRFKCKICPENMHSSDERKLHYLIRHPGQYHFECTICGKTFQYKSSLYIHRNNVHVTKSVTYTCNYCNKEFMKKDSFREHLMIHEGPRHACSYCPMRFVQRSNMLRHERRHTGERPYTCQHCGRTFADKGACNSHMRTHSRESFHSCMYCAQTFVQKSKLKYHLRKHTGEDLETCPICSKLFTSTYSLREHLKIHDDKISAVCPVCNKTYTDEKSIVRHIRRMHGDNSAQTCPMCNKTLSTIVGLRQHVLTHSKLKQFHCRCCSKSYSIKKSMIKHLRKRHSIKGTNILMKQYYKQLDARDCELGLDEEMLNSIFGQPKRVGNDVLLDDFVTIPNKNPLDKISRKKSSNSNADETNGEGSNNESDENEQEGENTDGGSSAGDDENDANTNLEPPSFVSIKIEPKDSDEDDE